MGCGAYKSELRFLKKWVGKMDIETKPEPYSQSAKGYLGSLFLEIGFMQSNVEFLQKRLTSLSSNQNLEAELRCIDLLLLEISSCEKQLSRLKTKLFGGANDRSNNGGNKTKPKRSRVKSHGRVQSTRHANT
jgi:hypothetical protein